MFARRATARVGARDAAEPRSAIRTTRDRGGLLCTPSADASASGPRDPGVPAGPARGIPRRGSASTAHRAARRAVDYLIPSLTRSKRLMTQAQQRPAAPMPPEQQEGQGIEAEMGLKPRYK